MPAYHPELSIQGLQELQAENNRMIATLKNVDPMVQLVVADLHRYAVTITHVATGSLRASHRMQFTAPGRAEIYIDPSAVNPRSKQRPAVYGVYEEERGGSHAFYSRTVSERGTGALDRAKAWLEQHL